MWKYLAVAAVLLATSYHHQTSWGIEPEASRGAQQPHHVVFHVNSGDEKVQHGALNNIRNLYQEFGAQKLMVELVVHGAGLPLLLKKQTTFANELTELHQTYGARYTACSNTMKTLKVTREDLISEVTDTVPAIVRLMERQEQGWAYIKP